MEVLITNEQELVDIKLDFIKEVALEIMKFEGSPENAQLSMVFCDDSAVPDVELNIFIPIAISKFEQRI